MLSSYQNLLVIVWNSGILMDDATILLCGHSFGSESLQRIIENVSGTSCTGILQHDNVVNRTAQVNLDCIKILYYFYFSNYHLLVDMC